MAFPHRRSSNRAKLPTRPEQAPDVGLYLAVLPSYRQVVVSLLHARFGQTLQIFTGAEHLQASVRTGISSDQYTLVRNLGLFGRRVLLQLGGWRSAIQVDALVVDLNPRSLTAWFLLVARRTLQKRTVVWGHLESQKYSQGVLRHLRLGMRRLSNGTVLYDYESREIALADLPHGETWVAPNAIYAEEDIRAAGTNGTGIEVLYVGRLEKDKRVDTLILAFAKSRALHSGAILRIVGGGSERPGLEAIVSRLGLSGSVIFSGVVTSVDALYAIYGGAVVSVSPGFAGLQITQSLGFGVPILVPRGVRHSPEIELERFGGVEYFNPADPEDLSARMSAYVDSGAQRLTHVSALVRQHYSAERMAEGIESALLGRHGK